MSNPGRSENAELVIDEATAFVVPFHELRVYSAARVVADEPGAGRVEVAIVWSDDVRRLVVESVTVSRAGHVEDLTGTELRSVRVGDYLTWGSGWMGFLRLADGEWDARPAREALWKVTEELVTDATDPHEVSWIALDERHVRAFHVYEIASALNLPPILTVQSVLDVSESTAKRLVAAGREDQGEAEARSERLWERVARGGDDG